MIAIGSDHGGYDLKEAVKQHLIDKGYEVKDVGCNDKSSCDYPVLDMRLVRLLVQENVKKEL